MNTQKNVQEMTDRELRTYMREYKRKLRRRRALIRQSITCVLTVFLLIICTISYHAIQTNASTGEEDIKFKYYTRITVASGETLWDIADEYIDYSKYKNKKAYIDEVQSINHLMDTDMIRSGQILIVPYYSEEYVK